MKGDVETPAPTPKGLRSEGAGVWDLVLPEKRSLSRLKKLSLRSRAWFTMLSWKQRRFMDLVIRMVDKIRGLLLLKALAPLVARLLVAIGGDARKGTLRLMDMGAYRMMMGVAEKIVRIAQSWKNSSAREWLDSAFLKYLMVMNLPQNKNPFTPASW